MRYSLLFLLVLTTGCSTVEKSQTATSVHAPAHKLHKQLDIGEIVKHKAYTLSYNEKYEQPNWVEYSLKCSDLKKNIKRTDDYRADPFVKTGTLSPSDYKNSGYDQGHLAPARDMSRSYEIMSESFYLSNMAPQLPYFNRYGLWKKSESAVRDWACQNEVLLIVAGPVLDNSVKSKGRLSIPTNFFKVVLASNEKMIAFIFPNSEIKDDIMKYAKTVDEVENITGIDFFSTLPDELEERLESSIDLEKWMISKGQKKYKGRK